MALDCNRPTALFLIYPFFFAAIFQGMNTPEQIVDAIGVETMVERLRVKRDRILRARRGQMLPASWFDFCERQLDQDLPRHLFSFK